MHISGNGRGGLRYVKDYFQVVEEMGYLDLLKKYPNPDVGNPLSVVRDGMRFTVRYLRHIYFLGTFKKYLQDKVSDEFTLLDLGCSYSIFSSLIKQEFSKSRHILVDLPGQLVLAHYYLGKVFPNARIAGFKEVSRAKVIDAEFIKKYDFILVPPSMYQKIAGRTVDVYCNFLSLTEMPRHWFDYYLQSDLFKTAKFFYSVNRYDGHPTYQDGLTVLDYPLDDFEKIFMRTWPLNKCFYKPFMIFGYKPVNFPSQLFQFIGKRKP